jgi:hypothetical protein
MRVLHTHDGALEDSGEAQVGNGVLMRWEQHTERAPGAGWTGHHLRRAGRRRGVRRHMAVVHGWSEVAVAKAAVHRCAGTLNERVSWTLVEGVLFDTRFADFLSDCKNMQKCLVGSFGSQMRHISRCKTG